MARLSLFSRALNDGPCTGTTSASRVRCECFTPLQSLHGNRYGLLQRKLPYYEGTAEEVAAWADALESGAFLQPTGQGPCVTTHRFIDLMLTHLRLLTDQQRASKQTLTSTCRGTR